MMLGGAGRGRGLMSPQEKFEKSLSVESNDSAVFSPTNGRQKMTFNSWNELRILILNLTEENYKTTAGRYVLQLQELLLQDLDYVEPVLLVIYEVAFKSSYSYPMAARLFEEISENENRIDDLVQDEIQNRMQRHLCCLQEKLKHGKVVYGVDTGIVYLLLNLCKLDGNNGIKYKGFIMLLKAIFEKFTKLLKTISSNDKHNVDEIEVIVSLLSSVGCFMIGNIQNYDQQLIKEIAQEFRQLSIRSKLSSLVLRHILHFLEVYCQGEHPIFCWCQGGDMYYWTKEKWLLGGCEQSLRTMMTRKLSLSSSSPSNFHINVVAEETSNGLPYNENDVTEQSSICCTENTATEEAIICRKNSTAELLSNCKEDLINEQTDNVDEKSMTGQPNIINETRIVEKSNVCDENVDSELCNDKNKNHDSGTELDHNSKSNSLNGSNNSLSDDAFQSERSNSPDDDAISISTEPPTETLSFLARGSSEEKCVPSPLTATPQSNDNIQQKSFPNSHFSRRISYPGQPKENNDIIKPVRSVSLDEKSLEETSIRRKVEYLGFVQEEQVMDANTPSEEIFIPRRCFNRVIGYERSVVRKIEAESGAVVWTFGFNSPRPETTNLTAHRLVTNALGVNTAMDEKKLMLEKEKINTAKFNQGPGERQGVSPLKITGNENQIKKAKDMIQRIVRTSAHLNILLPTISEDDLTGKLGLKLQSIEDLLSVCVEINTDKVGQLSLDIFGDTQSCKDAKSMIVQHLSSVESRKGKMVTIPEWFLTYLKSKHDVRTFVDRLSRMCGPYIQLLFTEGKPSMFIWGHHDKVDEAISIMTKLSSKLLNISANDSMKAFGLDESNLPTNDSDAPVVDEIPSDEKPSISDNEISRSSSSSPDLDTSYDNEKNVLKLLKMLESEPATPVHSRVLSFKKVNTPKKQYTYSKDDLLDCFKSSVVDKTPSWFQTIDENNEDYMRALIVRKGHGPSVLESVMTAAKPNTDSSSWRRKSTDFY